MVLIHSVIVSFWCKQKQTEETPIWPGNPLYLVSYWDSDSATELNQIRWINKSTTLLPNRSISPGCFFVAIFFVGDWTASVPLFTSSDPPTRFLFSFAAFCSELTFGTSGRWGGRETGFLSSRSFPFVLCKDEQEIAEAEWSLCGRSLQWSWVQFMAGWKN